MSRVKDGLVSFTAVFLLLSRICAGESEVKASQSIEATLGDDVVLPCELDPSVDASDFTVEWSRRDLDPRFVYVWRDGVQLESKQHPSYRGRTSLPIGNLKLGNVSLTLSRVGPSDEGTYRCFVPTLAAESAVELLVGVAPDVNISCEREDGSSAVLQCESKGWYPEPEVFWLDAEGNLLSAGPTQTVRGPDDLYTVSRRLTVRKSDIFTCRVQQKNVNKMRETIFNVPDDFFSDSSHVTIITSVVVSIVVVLAAVSAASAWRCKKNKTEQEEDEGSLQREAELEKQRDKLRSQLDEMNREWDEKKYDLVSRFQEGEERDAKIKLHQEITEVKEKLKETEEEIKRTETERRSQRKQSDENREMLPADEARTS